MFADTGVPLLFEAVRRLGAEKERLVVKVAGGAQFLDEQNIFNIGERNIEALGQLLSENGVVITAQDLGGMTSRTMRMELATGRITIHSPMKDVYFL